ncbi:uncharacterized protein V6R79_000277 [Siganus canaliculatus]
MSATVSRPPSAHQGPPNGNPYPNSNGPNSGPQDPRLNATHHDPGLSGLQHHVPTRPVFYVPGPPPPPPPPFLQYQWPMPFPYNPFSGFPGMGYGLVMPPFPPPPYMEGPAYILPQPHVQPIDYRRLLQPQVHASSAPFQNPNQVRRVRLPHTVPVRETVNSAVQTEPTHSAPGGGGDGSPLVKADSGHGTASNSPLSSSCNSQKQGSAKSDSYALTSREPKDSGSSTSTCTDGTAKQDFNIPHLTPTKTVHTTRVKAVENMKGHMDSAGQESVPPFRNGHSNMWSVSTSDSMVPVCSSSQQEDEIVKERRVSVPDILMSWGTGTPQTMLKKTRRDKEVSPNEPRLQSVYQHPAEPAANIHDAVHALATEARDSHYKLKLPLVLCELLSLSRGEHESRGVVGPEMQLLPYTDDSFPSPHRPQNVPEEEHENEEEEEEEEAFPHEDTAEPLPHPAVTSCQRQTRMNESIWSVESLSPYLPAQECLNQSVFEPEMITEMSEAENAHRHGLSVESLRERRQSCFISSDTVPMSDSWLIYNESAEKPGLSEMPETDHETADFKKTGPKQGPRTDPSEKDPPVSTAGSAPAPSEEHMDEKRSSEPEAKQSPNQVSLVVTEHREKSPCSPDGNETVLLNSVAGETLSASQSSHKHGDVVTVDVACGEEVLQPTNKPQCVPAADQSMVQEPLSKGHLVDCGIQCMTLKECVCSRDELQNRRHPLKCSDVKKANGGKADGFWKNQRRHNQWRGRGGNGKNQRY